MEKAFHFPLLSIIFAWKSPCASLIIGHVGRKRRFRGAKGEWHWKGRGANAPIQGNILMSDASHGVPGGVSDGEACVGSIVSQAAARGNRLDRLPDGPLPEEAQQPQAEMTGDGEAQGASGEQTAQVSTSSKSRPTRGKPNPVSLKQVLSAGAEPDLTVATVPHGRAMKAGRTAKMSAAKAAQRRQVRLSFGMGATDPEVMLNELGLESGGSAVEDLFRPEAHGMGSFARRELPQDREVVASVLQRADKRMADERMRSYLSKHPYEPTKPRAPTLGIQRTQPVIGETSPTSEGESTADGRAEVMQNADTALRTTSPSVRPLCFNEQPKNRLPLIAPANPIRSHTSGVRTALSRALLTPRRSDARGRFMTTKATENRVNDLARYYGMQRAKDGIWTLRPWLSEVTSKTISDMEVSKPCYKPSIRGKPGYVIV